MPDHECSCGGSCGCNSSHDEVQRVYLTKEEYVARLEDYLVRLQEEVEAVHAELAALKQPA